MAVKTKRRSKTSRLTARDERLALARIVQHRQHQQGDEIACSCGRRWSVGEDHP